MPRNCLCIGRHAAFPERLVWFGQTEIRAAEGETDQSIRLGIGIGIPDALPCPVGYPNGPNAAIGNVFVQSLNNFACRNLRVVTVKRVQIDEIRLQSFKARCDVTLDVFLFTRGPLWS